MQKEINSVNQPILKDGRNILVFFLDGNSYCLGKFYVHIFYVHLLQPTDSATVCRTQTNLLDC